MSRKRIAFATLALALVVVIVVASRMGGALERWLIGLHGAH